MGVQGWLVISPFFLRALDWLSFGGIASLWGFVDMNAYVMRHAIFPGSLHWQTPLRGFGFDPPTHLLGSTLELSLRITRSVHPCSCKNWSISSWCQSFGKPVADQWLEPRGIFAMSAAATKRLRSQDPPFLYLRPSFRAWAVAKRRLWYASSLSLPCRGNHSILLSVRGAPSWQAKMPSSPLLWTSLSAMDSGNWITVCNRVLFWMVTCHPKGDRLWCPGVDWRQRPTQFWVNLFGARFDSKLGSAKRQLIAQQPFYGRDIGIHNFNWWKSPWASATLNHIQCLEGWFFLLAVTRVWKAPGESLASSVKITVMEPPRPWAAMRPCNSFNWGRLEICMMLPRIGPPLVRDCFNVCKWTSSGFMVRSDTRNSVMLGTCVLAGCVYQSSWYMYPSCHWLLIVSGSSNSFHHLLVLDEPQLEWCSSEVLGTFRQAWSCFCFFVWG